MRRVGTVVRSAQGLAVVRTSEDAAAEAPDSLPVGLELIDESLQPVGRVVDVFGPVERPFLAVSPETGSVAEVVGGPVYARE